MDANEEYVRSRWKALGNLWWDREYDENWISASDEQGQHIRLFKGHSTDAEAWMKMGAADGPLINRPVPSITQATELIAARAAKEASR